MNENTMSKNCRRVVTGFDAAGESVIVSDKFVKNKMEKSTRPGVSLTNLWHTSEFPVEMKSDIENVDDEFIMFPRPNETICRISSFEPDKKYQSDAYDSASYFSDLDSEDTLVRSKRHPFMHKSKTVDYAIILEGEITLLLDNEEVDLSEGDIVVQRGTNHAWVNNSDKLCRVCFILMGAKQ
jgi:mannose-6-phosphate isomerase-like protein (cupin superfamily)